MPNWPEKVRTMQKNWIGKSSGLEIDFKLKNYPEKYNSLKVYTTRHDTLFGMSFAAISVDHPLTSILENDPKLLNLLKSEKQPLTKNLWKKQRKLVTELMCT